MSTETRAKPVRVLALLSDHQFAEPMRQLFANRGMVFETPGTPEDTLSLLRDDPPDVLILDHSTHFFGGEYLDKAPLRSAGLEVVFDASQESSNQIQIRFPTFLLLPLSMRLHENQKLRRGCTQTVPCFF